ncbi:MAG: sarcosine oxidase subunit gamma [Sneathiella sp.]|nr:MAG: sarcosine oxidase subunit gamma [Sneathiella sp.]
MVDQVPLTSLSEISSPAQINLRGDAQDTKFSAAIKSILGFDLPEEPNTVAQGADKKALWLSPDEWLIVGGAGSQGDLIWKLEKALEGRHVAINDLSSNRTIFEISGPHVHSILMKSGEMDFHPRVFGPGNCAQTLLAKSQAIVEQTDRSTFHIYVRCSFSRYVAAWLADAAAEFDF